MEMIQFESNEYFVSQDVDFFEIEFPFAKKTLMVVKN